MPPAAAAGGVACSIFGSVFRRVRADEEIELGV
jgi:hypothetical protein